MTWATWQLYAARLTVRLALIARSSLDPRGWHCMRGVHDNQAVLVLKLDLGHPRPQCLRQLERQVILAA